MMVILILTMALQGQQVWHSSGAGAGQGTGGIAIHEFSTMEECKAVGQSWENRMIHVPDYHEKRAFYLCVELINKEGK